jgi:hypothetical protein
MALITISATMIVPIATFGRTQARPCHLPLEFSERR